MPRAKQLTVEIGESLHRRLKVKSALVGKPMSAIVVELIERALTEHDQDGKELDGAEKKNIAREV